MISAEEVRDLLNYDPETGEFAWARDIKSKVRNRCYIRKGTRAGYRCERYWSIKIKGRRYQLHNVAWLYVHGRWPAELIDHVNRNGFDNRLCNLREATRAENQANRPKHHHNTSGFKGVTRRRDGKAWCAMFRSKHLGSFTTPEAAAAAYANAARRAYGDFVQL